MFVPVDEPDIMVEPSLETRLSEEVDADESGGFVRQYMLEEPGSRSALEAADLEEPYPRSPRYRGQRPSPILLKTGYVVGGIARGLSVSEVFSQAILRSGPDP